jgi:hypothetical protein
MENNGKWVGGKMMVVGDVVDAGATWHVGATKPLRHPTFGQDNEALELARHAQNGIYAGTYPKFTKSRSRYFCAGLNIMQLSASQQTGCTLADALPIPAKRGGAGGIVGQHADEGS